MADAVLKEHGEAGAGKRTNFRWIVLAMGLLLTIIANADRANFGVALPFIRQEMAMTNTEAGALLSLFFFGYAAMQLPGGFINSRFGMRLALAVSIIITSFFTFGLAFASSLFQLQALRLLIGIAEGPCTVGIVAIINNWFPAKEKGTATGIFLAGTKTGPLIVPPICAFVLSMWGWREIFYVFAIPGILVGLLWYFLVRNHPAENPFCSKAEADYIASGEKAEANEIKPKKAYNMRWVDKVIRARKVELLDTNKKLFSSWNLIGDSLAFAFMAGIVTIMMSWLPTYLITVKKLEIMKMAFAAAAPFAGTVLGNMCGGWMSDNVFGKRRKPLMLITTISTSVMMVSLLYAPADPFLLGALLFLTGFMLAVGYNGFFSYPMGLVTKERFPVAAGVMNTGGQLGGAIAPLVVGFLLDTYNWDMVFASLAVGSVICTLLVLTLVEPVEDPLV